MVKRGGVAALITGILALGAAPAAHAQGVTNPAKNPHPIKVTIDGQTYEDGRDTLPGYDDILCTPIPNVQFDFAQNRILYYDNDGELIDTAPWTEWSRISSYEAWLAQQNKPKSTPTPKPSTPNTPAPKPSTPTPSAANPAPTSAPASNPAPASAPSTSSPSTSSPSTSNRQRSRSTRSAASNRNRPAATPTASRPASPSPAATSSPSTRSTTSSAPSRSRAATSAAAAAPASAGGGTTSPDDAATSDAVTDDAAATGVVDGAVADPAAAEAVAPDAAGAPVDGGTVPVAEAADAGPAADTAANYKLASERLAAGVTAGDTRPAGIAILLALAGMAAISWLFRGYARR